jgi:hypothetical protein
MCRIKTYDNARVDKSTEYSCSSSAEKTPYTAHPRETILWWKNEREYHIADFHFQAEFHIKISCKSISHLNIFSFFLRSSGTRFKIYYMFTGL